MRTRNASMQVCMHLLKVRAGGVTRRKLQTPGIAEEHKRQETPTINPIGPTDTPHRPSTNWLKHYRKDSPGDAQHQLIQQPCTLQHKNNPPSSPTPDRVHAIVWCMPLCGAYT